MYVAGDGLNNAKLGSGHDRRRLKAMKVEDGPLSRLLNGLARNLLVYHLDRL